MLYEDLLIEWIEFKRLEIRNSSYRNYLYTMNNRIIPNFKNRMTGDITRKEIQTYIIEQSKELKQETVINITKILSQSFKYAIEEGYILDSPYKNIKIPKDKYINELNVFRKDDIDKIISVNGYSMQKKNIVNLAYRTGMRIGEILTLKWEDIDFEQKFLTVRRTLSCYNDSEPEICEPKTKESRRRIDLDKTTLEILDNMERRSEFVFCRKDGKIFSRQYITKSFRKMCESANVKYHSFHSLRHTHASILLANGVHPKIVQERLGHSKISTTMDIYSHLIPGMQAAAVDIFNTL